VSRWPDCIPAGMRGVVRVMHLSARWQQRSLLATTLTHAMSALNRTLDHRKARTICLTAAAGALSGFVVSSDRTPEGIAIACILGTATAALFGWSLVTSDPMESDASERSYVGARSPDAPELTYLPDDDSVGSPHTK
jgi:hypothetical protein